MSVLPTTIPTAKPTSIVTPSPPPSTITLPFPSSSSSTPAPTTSSPATSPTSSSSQISSPSSSSGTTTQSSSALTTTSTTTPSLTSTTPTPTPITVTSGSVVITTYVTSPATSVSNTPSSNNNAATTTTSFFHNTGAVAGVFTVVGVIALVVFIALVTNAVRRRRAQKFDRDVAEAAAEAAASSRSPFDDYPSGGNGGYPYSDSTHGTLVQAPMSLPNDNYGMNEMSTYDPYAAGAVTLTTVGNVGRTRSRLDSESRAPGIAGVGAGNLAREPSRRAPYHAFAGPSPQPHETLDHTPSMRYRRGPEMLEAVGLTGTGAAAIANQNGGAYVNRRPSQFTQQTHGSTRSQGRASIDNYPSQMQPGSQPPPRNDTQFADAYTGISNTPIPLSPALPNPHDAAPPFSSESQSHLIEGENFHDGAPPAPLRDVEEAERVSYADDEDYGQQKRVLRVANE